VERALGARRSLRLCSHALWPRPRIEAPPDFRSALAALGRYKSDLFRARRGEGRGQGGEGTLSLAPGDGSGAAAARRYDDGCAARACAAVAPVRVELARRPTDHALLRRHLGCPVVFASPHDAMVFDRSALDAPFVAADGGAFARLLERAARDDRAAAQRGASAHPRGRGAPTRTLQRRLDEGARAFRSSSRACGARRRAGYSPTPTSTPLPSLCCSASSSPTRSHERFAGGSGPPRCDGGNATSEPDSDPTQQSADRVNIETSAIPSIQEQAMGNEGIPS
jgi:hypothetical protein